MKTYEDLLQAVSEEQRQDFVYKSIQDYKGSNLYNNAVDAYEYFCKRNVTMGNFQKFLYSLSGEPVLDIYSANYKLTNAFFPIFIRQENSYLLGNGVTFNEDSTKDRLGDDFDMTLYKMGMCALWGGVAYGFWNLDHIDFFTAKEFVPIIGEEDGGLHAGIRWWQIDAKKPLRATLYEQDGYTEYMWKDGECQILKGKTAYKQIVQSSVADGTEIIDGENYPGFPIVPLYGNQSRQSELIGLRSKIDAYDFILSGFANNLEDAAEIFWTITNAGGMDDTDLAKFVERMKTVKAAVVDDQGSTAEAHTMDVPYQARAQALQELKDALYRDAMALDTDKISAGNVTATAIRVSKANLELKCDDYEMCVIEFIKGILALIGIQDECKFKRPEITNVAEDTQTLLLAAEYLDEETLLNHLAFISPDEVQEILKRRKEEEANRYEVIDDRQGEE